MDIFGDFGFAGGFNAPKDTYQDAQTCINWYPEISPAPSSKEAVALLGAPGLVQVAAVPGGGAPGFSDTMTAWPAPSSITNLPVRGMWVLPGWQTAVVVVANQCYLATITTVGNADTPGVLALENVGALSTSTGQVSIRDNNIGGYAVIVDGPYGYLYNISTKAFTKITDPAFLGASSVAYIDGWWIFNKPNSQTFYTNASPYSTAFDGTLFALKDAASDNLIGVIENKEELWLIGERTTEIWYDAGGQYFAFQRLVGNLLQVGCIAKYSIARLATSGDEGLIWLGRSERGENQVVRTKGFSWEVVSTPAVSNAISKFSSPETAIGYVYQADGHEFYVLTFPDDDQTWVYDATMPPHLAWTQRLAYDPYAEQFHRHRSNCYMDFGGMRVVGDYENGALYQLSRYVYNDAGWPLLARRRSPFIWNPQNRERVFMSSLQIDFAPGQGNATGFGSDPQAYLSMSRDYGTTFGPATGAPMGKTGNYVNRCMWRRLGWSRGAVAQIDVIDPVNRDLVGATLRAQGQ